MVGIGIKDIEDDIPLEVVEYFGTQADLSNVDDYICRHAAAKFTRA